MKGQITAPANPIYQVGLMVGGIWDREAALMDGIPRRQAYVSMLILGLCFGAFLGIFLMLALLLLF